MPRPRIAVVGTFDVDNYGDHLFPWVAAHELVRRHPGASVDSWSPYGWLHPTPLDEGRWSSPLGPWSPARTAAFAAAYDTVLVGGGEIIHFNDPLLAAVYGTTPAELSWLAPSRFFVEGLGPERERICPVVWNAVGVPVEPDADQARRLRTALASRVYVAVRDDRSERRLRQAGVPGPIAVVPDSALLLDRVLPPATVENQLKRLRAQGCYPPGAPLVVQGCDLLIPHTAEIAAAVRQWLAEPNGPRDVVVLETGRCRGDTIFGDGLTPLLAPHRVWRLPAASTIADIAAAVWGGSAFVGSSLHGNISALVYGRPFVVVNVAGEPKLDGFAELADLASRVVHDTSRIPAALDHACAVAPPRDLVPRLQAGVERHFDRIAAIAAASAAARADQPGRPERGAVERVAVADLVAWLRTGRMGGDAERRATLAEARLAALATGRTLRYSARARNIYGRLRRLRP